MNAERQLAVSFVTVSMNRHDHIHQALPTWLNRGFAEVVILDWSSTPSLRDIVQQHQDGTVVLIELVEPREFFHSAKSKNLRARLARHPVICSFDCDVKIHSGDFLARHPMEPQMFYAGGAQSLWGSGLWWAADWMQFNGCNEHMQGWGREDLDLHDRMKKRGWKWKPLCRATVEHIAHDDGHRVRHFPEGLRSKGRTNAENRRIAQRSRSWVQESFRVRIHEPNNIVREELI